MPEKQNELSTPEWNIQGKFLFHKILKKYIYSTLMEMESVIAWNKLIG